MPKDPTITMYTIAATGHVVQKSVDMLDRFIAEKGKVVSYWTPEDIVIYLGILAETAEYLDQAMNPVKQLTDK